VEDDLLPGDRIDLHARLAALLLERPDLGASTEAGAAAEIAGHWYAAECDPEALETSIRAAEAAEHVPAFAEAHALYERALELLPRVEAAGGPRPLDRVTLLERAAEAAMSSGARARAVELLREAIGGVEATADPWRAAALQRRLNRHLFEAGDTPAAMSALEAAVRLVPAEPPSRERAEVVAEHAGWLAFAGRIEEAEAAVEEARAVVSCLRARGEDARAIEISISDALGWCRCWGPDLPGAIEVLRPARLAALEALVMLDYRQPKARR
jgi:tetratricopeptide (TPR) repeat protein